MHLFFYRLSPSENEKSSRKSVTRYNINSFKYCQPRTFSEESLRLKEGVRRSRLSAYIPNCHHFFIEKVRGQPHTDSDFGTSSFSAKKRPRRIVRGEWAPLAPKASPVLG